MPIVIGTLSWRGVKVRHEQLYHPYQGNLAGTYQDGGWCIEICENGCPTSTDWSPYRFQRSEYHSAIGTIKWVLTQKENVMLSTGTEAGNPYWSSPPMELVTQYLGILEGKGYQIVGTNSTFAGEQNGPIWTWTLKI